MSPAKSENANRAEKRDHRREVTDSIIKMLEDGVAPWQKPWEGSAMPFNPTTERPYRGGNALHLLATGMGREYADPRWMTYKQAAEQGWQVRGGEKGTHIEFWEVKERSNEKDAGPDQDGGESSAKENGQRLIHRVYTVFNAKQIDGILEYQPKQRTPFEAVQAGERILANSGARIEHDQRDDAFYNRRSDSIHLPPKDAFKDAPGYYGTALHELAHWTGHPSRLNGPTLSESYRFGDLKYAKEELRAELALWQRNWASRMIQPTTRRMWVPGSKLGGRTRMRSSGRRTRRQRPPILFCRWTWSFQERKRRNCPVRVPSARCSLRREHADRTKLATKSKPFTPIES